MAIDVRPSRKTDVRALSRTLGRAFYEDPVMRWMLPDDAQRATGLPRTSPRSRDVTSWPAAG